MGRIFGFERQPYLRELEVEVLSVVEDAGAWTAILDDTILYPGGGGQPSDRGRLNDVAVKSVQKGSDGLQHVLESPVSRGPASLSVDWDRRYDHMQQHTAQHILTRTALNRLGWATRSFHIGPEVSDIELDCSPPRLSEIETLEDAVAEIIVEARAVRGFRVEPEEYAALDVRSRGLPADHQGDIRLVEIADFDVNTCGGTHLASTAEVEALKVVGSEPLRGGCRLFWVAGKRVRSRLAAHEQTMAELRQLLDTGDTAMVAALSLKLEQLQQARRAQRWLEKRLAESLVEALLSQDESFVDLHLKGFEAGLLRPIAESFARQGDRHVAFLTSEGEAGSLFALVAGKQRSTVDIQALGGGIAEILQGRGGGAGQVFQGKTESFASRPQAIDLIRANLS